jgi:hypothetical protein
MEFKTHLVYCVHNSGRKTTTFNSIKGIHGIQMKNR